MDTQCNSIDIANLRDFALGIGDLGEVSISSICPGDALPIMRAGLLTPSTLQVQEPDVSPQAPASTNSRDHDDKEGRTEDNNHSKIPKENPGHNGRGESAIAGLRHQITKSRPPQSSSVLRLTASQPRLPSTVPDSHEARMATASYQSQGDTQPLSQGVQEEFRSRMREQQGASVPDTTGIQDRSHSYQPGETGHIDFVTDFEQPFTTQFEEQIGPDDDIDPISQAADVRAELYPESKRFQEPITPATAGNKRLRDGATLSRENTTPRLPVNPFAGQNGRFDGMMDASQAFKATQFTSPLPNQAIAEGFSDRPSPEMSNPPRPSTADPQSSPAKLPRSNMARAVTEPQTTYVSIQESQAERDRLSKLADPLAQEDSDNGFDSDGSELRRRRKRRRLEMEEKTLFEGVTARARPGSRGRGRGGRRAYIQRSSPRRPSGRAPIEAVLISDDPLAEGNDTEDETEHEQESSESDTDSIDELAEDNKENIGTKRVQVPMTASRANLGRTTRISSQSSPSRFQSQKSLSASMKVTSESRPILSTASTEAAEFLPRATQTVAIVDSQPSRGTKSRRSPKPVRQESIVLQSSLEVHVAIPHSQLSPGAGNDQPRKRDGDRDPARTPNVPASSTIHSTPNANSSAFLQTRIPDIATSEQGGRMPISVSARNDTTSTDHDLTSPSRPSDNQAIAATHEPTATAKESAPSRETAQDPPSERPRDKPAVGTLMTSDDGNRLQPQSHTNGPVSSEEQVTQIRASSTIPETSSTMTRIEQRTASRSSSGRLRSTQGASRPDPNAEHSIVQSNASTAFNTAATHMTSSPAKSRNTQLSSEPLTPISKNTRPRTIAEIAANPSPSDPIGSVDVDVDFLSKDDRDFQAVMSGSSPVLPARKRRRGRTGQILQVADSETKILPPPTVNEPPTGSAAENIAFSSHRNSVEHTVEKTPATTPVTEDRASSQPSPSVEQPSDVVSDNSGVQKNGRRTPFRNTAPPPSATQNNSRKRGRPRKDIKVDIEPDRHFTNRPEGDTFGANQTLRIEVPRRLTGDPSGSANSENGPIVAPNQVFAHFNGNCPGYYPATCIGITGGEESQYRVRFDDGMIDTINGYGIKRLELRRGDYVKLDQVGARKHVYIVERVHDRQPPLLTPDPETPRHHVPFTSRTSLSTSQTDIRGYASLVVSLKQANVSDKNPSNPSMTVPVKDLYLTQTMWTSLKDRSYTYKPLHPAFPSRLETPSERTSNPSTPSSRSRRLKPSNTTHPRSTLHASASTTIGIFTTMAFAITNISDATLRTALRHQITTNGGRLLADGFNELLHIPSLGPASPSKRSPKKSDSASSSSTFDLTERGKQTGFTCLLADKHCRMAKYIQALALGIPCLATRWIQDCVAKKRVLPWQPYLLAAGDSSFLGGAVRSRILPAFPPETTTLTTIIGSRAKPLDGDSVLLIMEKGEEEKMKSHPLITHALGASKVSRATSLEAAARATKDAEINGEPWTWVFSLDKEDKTEKTLFGRGVGGKKRKRESGVVGNGVGGQGAGTRVVGNEFVIQSLILGRLVE